ncbi:MAG: hypothetical protein KJN71_10520, partial [Acidimicrobiia bacterium]|nr:hypothetical protein [Acidimicrobiia bacterium]
MRYQIANLVVAALLFGGSAAWSADGVPQRTERFDYRWTLAGFKGAMARLFVPGQGEGRLTTGPNDLGGSENLVTELRISSRDAGRSDFWLYGAEIDPSRKRTVRAWSAQRFRGKSREREREADGVDVLDLASSIYYLRKELPSRPREERIWSSGRPNAVLINPGPRRVVHHDGKAVVTRSYAIRGQPKPGKPTWRGQLDLVLTDDENAIPLEIVVSRKGMR